MTKLSGTSMPITLMFFMVIGMVTVVSVGLSQTTDSMVFRGTQKVQATELAESGIQTLYDQICIKMKNGTALNQNLSGLTLNSTLNGTNKDLGQMAAEVVDVTFQDISPAPGKQAGTTLRTYKFQIKGTGTAPNGVQSIVMATFTGEVIAASDAFSDPTKEWMIYPAAIQANANVFIKADSNVRTLDSATVDKEAHIIANRGVKWEPATGAKATITAPDVISVDGFVLVPNQPVDTFYDQTKSAFGLGNSSSVKNYRTAGPWVNKANQYAVAQNDVTPLGHDCPFPTTAQTRAWESDWRSTIANSSKKSNYTKSSSQDIPSSEGIKKVEAPAFFAKGLQISETDVVHLIPKSQDPNENIVFVNGDIINEGTIVNHGVTLVARDSYSDTQTAQYTLDSTYSTYTDLMEIYKKAGLLTLGGGLLRSQNAAYTNEADILIQSDVSGKYGLVYSVNGAIKVTGNLEINGTLVSGMTQVPNSQDSRSVLKAVRGGIHIEPRGGSNFTLSYIRDTKGFTLPNRLVDNSKVIVPFRADALSDWMQKK